MADVTGTKYFIDADIGYGSEFLVGQGDPSPETFSAVYGVVEMDLGGFENEIHDKTHLRSIGRAREKLVGLADYENITIRCRYNPASVHGSHKVAGGDGFSATHNLPALQKSGAEVNFMVLIGSGSPQQQIDIVGSVSGRTEPKISTDELVEVTYTITPLRDFRP